MRRQRLLGPPEIVDTGDRVGGLVRRVFGARGPGRPHSLRVAVERGLVPECLMPLALRVLRDLDSRPLVPTWALPARGLYNDPGWDNVVRALEEDR